MNNFFLHKKQSGQWLNISRHVAMDQHASSLEDQAIHFHDFTTYDEGEIWLRYLDRLENVALQTRKFKNSTLCCIAYEWSRRILERVQSRIFLFKDWKFPVSFHYLSYHQSKACPNLAENQSQNIFLEWAWSRVMFHPQKMWLQELMLCTESRELTPIVWEPAPPFFFFCCSALLTEELCFCRQHGSLAANHMWGYKVLSLSNFNWHIKQIEEYLLL